MPGAMTQPDARKAALATLAEAGAHFVLCAPDKRPKAKSWHKIPAQLDAALRHNGLVGVVPASLGCVVVDVDEGGAAAADAVISQLGLPLAKVPTQRTDGWHLWFRCREADEIGNRAWQGGDIRGAKGQAILWAPDLVAPGLASAAPVADLLAVDLARLPSKRACGAVGERNNTLNRGVFLATLNGQSIDEAVAAAREAGLPEREIAATVESAQKAADARGPTPASGDLTPLGVHSKWMKENSAFWRYLVTGTSAGGTWAKWDGARFKRLSSGYAFRNTKALVSELVNDIVKTAADPDKARQTTRALRQPNFVAAVETYNAAEQIDQLEDYDAEPLVINTPGGVVNLQTGEIVPHEVSQRFLKIAGATPTTGAPCPTWLRCLNDWCGGDKEMVDYIQRLVGYSLRGDNQEHVVVFLYGPGANGKSVFLRVLQALHGDYSATASHRVFTADKIDDHPTSIAALVGSRLAAIPEVPPGARFDEEALKRVSGGDKLAARFMRQDFFEFIPQFLPLIVGNNEPSTRDVGESMTRRLHVIPFDHTIPEDRRDKELLAKLMLELGAIMQWAVAGHAHYLVDKLTKPERVREATDAYFEDHDRIGRFLAEWTTESPDGQISASLLYGDYIRWINDQGERPESQRRFGQGLASRGVAKEKKSHGFVYLGRVPRNGGY